jgi:type IV pilus assembly protein PilX
MSMDKTTFPPSLIHGRRETGAALITGLIFLAVLTMIGVTTAKVAGLEERMSGNLRDRSLAMQAAEMTLRYAERDVFTSGRISGLTGFITADCGHDTVSTLDDGLCPATDVIWTNANWNNWSVEYGDDSVSLLPAVDPIPLVSAQPRYTIEGFLKKKFGGNRNFYFYRITVRAQGVSANTVVLLEELMEGPSQ